MLSYRGAFPITGLRESSCGRGALGARLPRPNGFPRPLRGLGRAGTYIMFSKISIFLESSVRVTIAFFLAAVLPV